MEAARVLKLRGFQPVVYEQRNEIGGQLVPGCKPPDKEVIKWYQNALLKSITSLNVEVITGRKAEPQQILADHHPFAVIVATGAKPLIPSKIPGVNNANVFNALDVLNNPVIIPDGSKVAIVGGGMTGCELAELISGKNCTSTIIEMQSEVAASENSITRSVMLKRLNENTKIELLTGYKVLAIRDEALELEEIKTGEKKQIRADYSVLSLGLSPLSEEIKQWKEVFEKTYVVGDAEVPSKVAFAIRTAFDTAYTV
jgi:pyruvate/2-oxoglutarate dehydrogenase complex dihydrolipoamide dehydrogenase (E3) component